MIRATTRKCAVLLVLLFAAFMPAGAAAQPAPSADGSADGAVLGLRSALAEEKRPEEKARLHKRLGDLMSASGEMAHASTEYLSALSLSRDFTAEERLRMARVLSWAGRLDESIAELDRILAENPRDRAARIHLARCQSWKGRLRRAEREIGKVLAEHPGDREAGLVKANLRRWRGDISGAIALYREGLEGDDAFSARAGLAYAFLSVGDIRRARAERALLKAEFPYQEKELAELDTAIGAAAAPAFEPGYAYYEDSDDNRVDRLHAGLSAWASFARLGIALRGFDARDGLRTADARQASIGVSSRFTESAGIHASAGVHQSRAAASNEFGTGGARLEFLVPRGTLAASAAKEVMTDTAQLIGNSIRVSSYQAYLSQYLGCGFTADGSFARREYSDDNRSDDVNMSLRHAFDVRAPNVSLGYRFRYRDFERESGSGYFDPGDYRSHLAFLALSHEGKRFSAYIEPYGGHEEFKRRGARTSQWVGGGSGTFGVKVRQGWTVEANVEGGTNSAGAAAGFDYYVAGVRLRATF